MKLIMLFILTSIITANLAFAHGENKLGPHDGYIRMPGTFHTELVQSHDNSFSIYLMDVNNKNPTTKDSSAQLTYFYKNIKSELTCFPIEDHFTCKPNEKINSKQGKLIINAVRSNIKSNDAIYELPLRLSGEGKAEDKKHDMSKM